MKIFKICVLDKFKNLIGAIPEELTARFGGKWYFRARGADDEESVDKKSPENKLTL